MYRTNDQRIAWVFAGLLLLASPLMADVAYDPQTQTITLSGGKYTPAQIASSVKDTSIFMWDEAKQTAVCGADLVVASDATLEVEGTKKAPIQFSFSPSTDKPARLQSQGTVLMKHVQMNATNTAVGYQILLNGPAKFNYVHFRNLMQSTNSWVEGLRLAHDDILIADCVLSEFVAGSHTGFSFGNYPKKHPTILRTKVSGLTHSYINYAHGMPTIRDCDFSGNFYTSYAKTTLVNVRANAFLADSPDDTTELRYYLDVQAVDEQGKPLADVTVHVIPENQGTVTLNQSEEKTTDVTTDKTGHTPLPSTGQCLVLTSGIFKKTTKEMFTYTIQVLRDDTILGELNGVAPDVSWYRQDLNKPAATYIIHPGKWKVNTPKDDQDMVRVERPNLLTPISLLIDDAAPGINPLYYFRTQVNKMNPKALFKGWEGGNAAHPMVKGIPLSFCKEFSSWLPDSGFKGKFTVLAYPAGLGKVDSDTEAYSASEAKQWLAMVRDQIAPSMDITPEVLTHTRGLNIKTGKLRDLEEGPYLAQLSNRDPDALVAYIRYGLRILINAGFDPTGLTHPASFAGGNHQQYARSTAEALDLETHHKVSFMFVDVQATKDHVLPELLYYDRDTRRAVISLIANTKESTWDAIAGKGDVQAMADYYLTKDGKSGRFIDLINQGCYILFYTHWQTLYANGTKKGLLTMQELNTRIKTRIKNQIQWMKASDIARYWAAKETTKYVIQTQSDKTQIVFDAPFECSNYTLSMPATAAPSKVTLVGVKKTLALEHAEQTNQKLLEGTWRYDNGRVYVCLRLADTSKLVLTY